jgi:hypothetical protein
MGDFFSNHPSFVVLLIYVAILLLAALLGDQRNPATPGEGAGPPSGRQEPCLVTTQLSGLNRFWPRLRGTVPGEGHLPLMDLSIICRAQYARTFAGVTERVGYGSAGEPEHRTSRESLTTSQCEEATQAARRAYA